MQLPEHWETQEGVYPPREDSFLAASVLEDMPLAGKTVLDMGTGSGLLAYVAAEQGAAVSAVDINPDAVENAQENLDRAGYDCAVYRSDLFAAVTDVFDVVVFNPPYIPAGDEFGTVEEKAWNGGRDGRETIDPFIDAVPEFLKESGVVVLVQSSKNGVDETVNRFEGMGLRAAVAAREKVAWEEILVLTASRSG